jgi:hypothetical protein
MSQSTDRQELERPLEQAKRLASEISDQTTYQRLKAFVEDLRESLQWRLAACPRTLGTARAAYGTGSRVLVTGRAGTQRG